MSKKNAVFTVSEAGKMHCPKMLSNANEDLGTTCLTNACMAWRWHTTHIRNPMAGNHGHGDLVESSSTYGFCGLAGGP